MHQLNYHDGQVLDLEREKRLRAEDLGNTNRERLTQGLNPIEENPKWEAFCAMVQPGDQLQWFLRVRGPRDARFGYRIMRGEKQVASYLVGMA